MNDDMGLVREYVACHSEQAFEALVSRHVGLVHSAALRQVGDPSLAEEITQTVFIILARKAESLNQKTILSGWLYRTTRYVSAAALKIQRRRERREQEAHMQAMIEQTQTDSAWEQFAPMLDEAMAQLRDRDRDAIVLRYFQNKSLRDVGTMLGVDESVAQKRVGRAVEKLRLIFAKRGIVSTSLIITGAISSNSTQAAPMALVKSVTVVAIAKGASANGSTLTLIKGALKLMAWTKAKTAMVIGLGVLLAAGTVTVEVRNIHLGEPSYGGKTLTDWLEGSKNFVFVTASDTSEDRKNKDASLQQTYDAVQHIGQRAIPTLLQWVANTTNGGGNILAAGCIEKLGPQAEAATPGLITILGKNDEAARYSALNVLQRIGPAAEKALPAILDHIQHDPSGSMRSFAVTTLANNGVGKVAPDTVIPVLIECLEPSNAMIDRPDTLRALGGLGEKAKAAVPAILPYLNDPNKAIRQAAGDALRKIQPSAGTQTVKQ